MPPLLAALLRAEDGKDDACRMAALVALHALAADGVFRPEVVAAGTVGQGGRGDTLRHVGPQCHAKTVMDAPSWMQCEANPGLALQDTHTPGLGDGHINPLPGSLFLERHFDQKGSQEVGG